MDEILQKVSRLEKSICPKCCHYHVCLAIDNQPCFECNQFMEVVRCEDCDHGSHVDCPEGRVWCDKMCRYMVFEGFCSYGEKRNKT